jgi:Ca-activated chloride channel family protein
MIARFGPSDAQTSIVPVPLKHTDVRASIAGWVASTQVTQQFHNPYNRTIEATYVFPLPENAAITDFVMTIAGRTIRGMIREREDAQRIYDIAKSQGQAAALMTQERPNIFTQAVANIDPGRQIDVSIRYFHTLQYREGGFEYVFPMVVGPRFNPPYTPNLPVGAGQSSGTNVEIPSAWSPPPIAAPAHARPGTDIALAIDLGVGEQGSPFGDISSPTHKVQIDRPTSRFARVTLSPRDTIPNRDFVLRYTLAGRDAVRSALLTQPDVSGQGGHFALFLMPPDDVHGMPRMPMEVVFVVDRSGSMNGKPMEIAQQAILRGLSKLEDADTFQIIDFAETSSELGAGPLLATSENLRRGRRYAEALTAGGGTMMINGLRTSLALPSDPWRLRVVCFLTDGYIGNESEIMRELSLGLGSTRVFGVGIGSSPNRFLIDRMSLLGRGAAAYITLKDNPSKAMDAFFAAATRPAMTDLSLDFGTTGVSDVWPSGPQDQLPDLLPGRPVVISGRYSGSMPSSVRISGRTVGGVTPRALIVTPEPLPAAFSPTLIPSLWARARIAGLCDRMLVDDPWPLAQAAKSTALSAGMMSPFTSFVAVDSMTRSEFAESATTNIATQEEGRSSNTWPPRSLREPAREGPITVPVPIHPPAGTAPSRPSGDPRWR